MSGIIVPGRVAEEGQKGLTFCPVISVASLEEVQIKLAPGVVKGGIIPRLHGLQCQGPACAFFVVEAGVCAFVANARAALGLSSESVARVAASAEASGDHQGGDGA